jgi:hypothetical protein
VNNVFGIGGIEEHSARERSRGIKVL